MPWEWHGLFVYTWGKMFSSFVPKNMLLPRYSMYFALDQIWAEIFHGGESESGAEILETNSYSKTSKKFNWSFRFHKTMNSKCFSHMFVTSMRYGLFCMSWLRHFRHCARKKQFQLKYGDQTMQKMCFTRVCRLALISITLNVKIAASLYALFKLKIQALFFESFESKSDLRTLHWNSDSGASKCFSRMFQRCFNTMQIVVLLPFRFVQNTLTSFLFKDFYSSKLAFIAAHSQL